MTAVTAPLLVGCVVGSLSVGGSTIIRSKDIETVRPQNNPSNDV